MIALTNCKAVTIVNGILDNATILVEDALIKAVGVDVENAAIVVHAHEAIVLDHGFTLGDGVGGLGLFGIGGFIGGAAGGEDGGHGQERDQRKRQGEPFFD